MDLTLAILAALWVAASIAAALCRTVKAAGDDRETTPPRRKHAQRQDD